jgi:hypothetical protein
MTRQFEKAIEVCDLKTVFLCIDPNVLNPVSDACWYNLGVLCSDEKKIANMVRYFLLYSDPPVDSRFRTNKFKGLVRISHQIREKAAQLVQDTFDEHLQNFPTSVAGIVAGFLPNHEIRQKALS